MYTPAGRPDPCGPSIHNSASYHWGDGPTPTPTKPTSPTPRATPKPSSTPTTVGRPKTKPAPTPPAPRPVPSQTYPVRPAQTTQQTEQHTDLRFLIGQPETGTPEDELTILSYQFATEPSQHTFLTQFLTLEQDHLCPLRFRTIRLATRTTPGSAYPIPCKQESPK